MINKPITSSHELLSEPELAEQPSTQAQSFDYEALGSETRIVVRQRTSEIKSLIRQTAEDIIDIGQKLIEVKKELAHGQFINWLKAEFNWSRSTATKFMQVAKQFKGVNFTHLEIAASALYLMTAASTSELAREEALERAAQGEFISYTEAKTIIARHKAANLKASKPVTVNVPSVTAPTDSFTPVEPRPAPLTIEAEAAAVVEQSEDKLPQAETEAPAQFQASNYSDNVVPAADSSERLVRDQTKTDIQSLLRIGNLIYFTDLEQQESKLLGEVAEVKAATATEVVIKISIWH